MGRPELGPALGSSQPREVGAIQQLGLGPVLSARSRGASNAPGRTVRPLVWVPLCSAPFCCTQRGLRQSCCQPGAALQPAQRCALNGLEQKGPQRSRS